MKKQKKQFFGMLLVLAVLAAAYGGIHVYNQKQEEKEAGEEKTEKLTVVDFETDDVTAFSYVLGGQVYAYTKTDGEWTWDGDISLTLDTSQIDAMLDAVTGLTAESEITTARIWRSMVWKIRRGSSPSPRQTARRRCSSEIKMQ